MQRRITGAPALLTASTITLSAMAAGQESGDGKSKFMAYFDTNRVLGKRFDMMDTNQDNAIPLEEFGGYINRHIAIQAAEIFRHGHQ